MDSLKQAALAEGADQATVDALFNNPQFVDSLSRSLTALEAAEQNGWSHKSGAKRREASSSDGPGIVVTLDTRLTDGEKVLYSLGEVRDVLSTLPPEQVQAASLALQTMLGGPFGAAKGYLVSTAAGWAFGDAVETVTAGTTQAIHNALTGKKWDDEYSWTGPATSQNGARLAAELLVGGVAVSAGAGAGVKAKGAGKGQTSSAKTPETANAPAQVNVRNKDHGHHTPPKVIEGIKDLQRISGKNPVRGGGFLRARWVDKKGNIYEWDYQHGTLEKYNKRGKHLGEFDPHTGHQTKPANKARRIER